MWRFFAKEVEALLGVGGLDRFVVNPKLGGLVYVCSTSAPINLSAMLGNAGFAARMTPLYAISRLDALPQKIADALKTQALDCAVFFSADEARAFALLVQRANLDATTAHLVAIVAAPVVAAPLTVLKFARIVTAVKSACTCAHAHVNMHPHMYVCTCTCMHVQMCVRVPMHVRT